MSMYICSVQPRSLQKTRRYSFSLLQMLEERWTLDLRTAVAHESLGKHMECFASQYFLGYRQPFTFTFASCAFICDCIHICFFICIYVCIREHRAPLVSASFGFVQTFIFGEGHKLSTHVRSSSYHKASLSFFCNHAF